MTVDDRLPPFEHLRIAVIGDAVADRYVYARPSRLSREAPVPVFVESGEEIRPGGAANVAANLAALGCRTTLVAPIGGDVLGRALVRDLEERGIAVVDAHESTDYRLPVKTRVLASGPHRTPQQVLRLDREPTEPPSRRTCALLASRFPVGQVDAVLYSDYGYTDLSAFAELDAHLRTRNVVRVLDPRDALPPFEGLDAVTPNLDDFVRLAGAQVRGAPVGADVGREDVAREDVAHGEDDALADRVASAADAWRERTGIGAVLVTLGNLGMVLAGGRGIARVAPSGREGVVDVSGAGDTAAAVFAASLALDLEPAAAMALANAAAGEVVMVSGTAQIDRDALAAALRRAPRSRPAGSRVR